MTTFESNDYTLSSDSSTAANAGVGGLSLPVTTDRAGATRSNPPEIGMYELSGGGAPPAEEDPGGTITVTLFARRRHA